MLDPRDSYVHEEWQHSILPTLHDYIRIPNKSPAFDPDWAAHGHMQTAAELLHGWISARDIAGLQHEIVTLPGRTPVLFCEIPATGPDAETVLLYGHYDKQPEFDG